MAKRPNLKVRGIHELDARRITAQNRNVLVRLPDPGASHCPARVTSPYLRDLLFFFKRECQMLSELVIGSSCLRRWPLPTSRIGLSLPDSSAIAIGGGTCLRLNLQYQRVLRHHWCFKIERWPSRTMSCRACRRISRRRCAVIHALRQDAVRRVRRSCCVLWANVHVRPEARCMVSGQTRASCLIS